MLVNYPTETNDVRFRDTNGAKEAMRTATKNILYVVANSRAYAPENLKGGMASWKKLAIALDVILGLLLCLWCFANFKRFAKENKEYKAELARLAEEARAAEEAKASEENQDQ